MKRLLLLGVVVLAIAPLNYVNAQEFLGNLSIGIGGGINFSTVTEIDAINVVESLDETPTTTTYSKLFKNPGSQFFFHAEYTWERFRFALLPGTYTYKYATTVEENYGTDELVEHSFDNVLRYTNIPLQVKYIIAKKRVMPFIGGQASYGRLMSENGTYIKSNFSAGPVAGVYYETFPVTWVFTAGYQVGLHNISNRNERFDSTTNPFATTGDLSLNNLSASISVLFNLNVEQPIKGLKCKTPNTNRR